MDDQTTKPSDNEIQLNDCLNYFDSIAAALEVGNAACDTASDIAHHAARLLKVRLSNLGDRPPAKDRPPRSPALNQDRLMLLIASRSQSVAAQLRDLGRAYVTDPLTVVTTLIQEQHHRMKKGPAANAKKNA